MIALESIEKLPGIYLIRNTMSDRVYVGSSRDVRRRLFWHRSQLRNGKHVNPHIQRAWERDGEAAFTCELLERVDDYSQLEAREAWWMAHLTARETGYNLNGAECRPGRESPETGRKRSVALMGHPVSDVTRQRMRDAAAQRCRTPEELAALIRCRPTSRPDLRAIMAQRNQQRDWTPEARAAHGERRAKSYTLLDPQGNLQKVSNLRAFCREHDLNNGAMSQVVLGKKRSYKGWTRA